MTCAQVLVCACVRELALKTLMDVPLKNSLEGHSGTTSTQALSDLMSQEVPAS